MPMQTRKQTNTKTPRRFPYNRLLAGFFLSSGIGWLAYRRRSLSRSGVAGAITTGTTTFGLGGLAWGLTLIFFFGSSSFLSHFREKEKTQTAVDKFSKGSQRDLGQVAANGALATALALGYGLTPSTALKETLQAGYVGALATANADTWATELGVLSKKLPHLLTTGKPTQPGTSGAVTLTGSTAAAGGAFSLGLIFYLLQRGSSLALVPIALISGLAGSFFDSLLGATVQAIYYCPACHKETEQQVHRCGTQTQPLRGLHWMNNDIVNMLATMFGTLVAMLIYLPIQRHKERH